MPERLIPGRHGLQAARTDLSWLRTALIVLINGGLLLIRNDLKAPGAIQLSGAVLAFLLAIFMLMLSFWRGSVLSREPLPERLWGTMPFVLLASGVVLLGSITLLVIIAT